MSEAQACGGVEAAGGGEANAGPSGGGGSSLLELDCVSVHLPLRRGLLRRSHEVVHALDEVSVSVAPGESLGIVGESGCGKTTLIRCAARLTDATAGRIRFEGQDITRASRRRLRCVRARMQMVFQDSEASLNPRKRISQILSVPLRLRGVRRSELPAEVSALLSEVGLAAEHSGSHPHQLSGGQRQRVGIARALALRPRLLLLDEPVSALDVSIRAQIVNLLADLRERHQLPSQRLAMLFVAHDLAIVRQVSDRIAVMYLGRVVESGPAVQLCNAPVHPYTEALLAAVPAPDPATGPPRVELGGEPPSAISPPPGCRFHPRCPYATEVCGRVQPPLVEYEGGRLAACHHPLHLGEAESGAVRVAS
jgi:oligopeptide/dipeptide ABC transporter ATP-binding protein